jgi:hypothetical protein
MAKKKPLCCVIDYDTKDGTNWKAGILAYSVKDAVAFVRAKVNNVARVNSTEGGRQIDAVEPTVFKDYFTEEVVEEIEVVKEIEVPVEVIKEVYVTDEDAEPACPWCKKTFKTEQTLKTHCRKYHLKDD